MYITNIYINSLHLTPKVWFNGKKTGLESERFRIWVPVVPLKGGYKSSLSPKVFPALDWGIIPLL
jgi:hypothetical protein